MTTSSTKIPIWFWIVTIFMLLWNIMGVMTFFQYMFISDETLAAMPDNERALYGEYPMWTNIVFAMAVFGGTMGSIGLLLKKKWARTMFIISLIGIIPQMIHNVFMTGSMEVYGPGSLIMPILVVVLGIFLLWFANYSIKKNWLS